MVLEEVQEGGGTRRTEEERRAAREMEGNRSQSPVSESADED